MGFKGFPVYRLEELIGQKTLDKVAGLLPAFDSSIDPDNIYTKKNLIKIIYSFFDSSDFSKSELRREFLSYETESEINSFCEKVNIPKNLPFNDKVSRIVSKGWSNIEFCIKFSEHFNLPETFIPQEKVEYPNYEVIPACESPFKVLKDYQSDISFRAVNNLEYRNARFIIQMPTGSGKTRTAMEIIANAFNSKNNECIIFWLVYAEELCEQAVESFLDIWKHIGNKEIKLDRAWGRNYVTITDEDKFVFVVGGFQKLYSQMEKEPELFSKLKNRTFLIVVDEAHRVMAHTYKKVTDSLFGDNCRLIGLTATPGRGIDNTKETEKLSEYFNKEKLDITVPEGKTVFSHFKSRGILAYANFKPLVTSPSFSLTKKDIKYLQDHFDFPPAFVKKIGEDETRNVEIINELKSQLTTHEKALFFGCSVEHSKFICSILHYLGVKAAHVDGSTDKGARQATLNEFKNGNLQIICNFGILSTGFDAPKTDLVFISRPTRSIVLYSQMIGRGLRGPAVGGTEHCTVVTVKDNIIGLPNESNIFTYFDEYFDN